MTNEPHSFLSKHNPLFSSLLIVLAAMTNSLAADSTPPTSAETTNSPARLPSVTVTAQKQPAPVEGLPVSVTAVTAETLHDADVRLVRDAEIYAPNVFLNEFSARKL